MRIQNRFNIAKCSIEKPCKKCGCVGDAIVVNKTHHYALYCANCGAYIKHASVEDKRHFYVAKAIIEDLTPMKLCALYNDSKRTMLNK